MYHIDYREGMSIRKREGVEMGKQEDSKEDKEKDKEKDKQEDKRMHDTGRRNIAGQKILHPVRE